MKLNIIKFGHGLEVILAVAFQLGCGAAMTWVRAWCVYAKYGIFRLTPDTALARAH